MVIRVGLLWVLWMIGSTPLWAAQAPAIEAWSTLPAWSAKPELTTQAATWVWRAMHEAPGPVMPEGDVWVQPRPHLALISHSDGLTRARVAIAGGDSLSAAVRQATATALREGAGDSTRWVTVELVQTVLPARLTATLGLADFEHGLDGLVFDLGEPLVLAPSQIVAWDLVSRGGRIDPQALQQALGPDDARPAELLRQWRAGGLRCWTFTTAAAFAGSTGVAPLYRGHRTDHDLTAAGLLRSSAAAGQYLARHVDDAGRFVYEFRPQEGKPGDGEGAYNIVRHNGTIYAMMELHARVPDPALLAGAKRALEYLRRSIHPMRLNDVATLCVVEGDEVKLGGVALAILAMAEHVRATGDRSDLDAMRGLAQWILATQAGSGEFLVHKKLWPDGQITPFESGYYPGEAIFALMRLHELTGEAQYLDSASRAAMFLITQRDRGLAIDQLMHDHWLLYGLNELSRVRPDPVFSTHARRLVTAIVDTQHRRSPYPDWIGGFYEPPRVTPTATRAEGLLAAWRMFHRQGDAATTALIRPAALDATTFQLHLQVGPELAMHLPEPLLALGGFRDGYHDVTIRIDYVQHSISALLATATMLELDHDGPAASENKP